MMVVHVVRSRVKFEGYSRDPVNGCNMLPKHLTDINIRIPSDGLVEMAKHRDVVALVSKNQFHYNIANRFKWLKDCIESNSPQCSGLVRTRDGNVLNCNKPYIVVFFCYISRAHRR